MRKIIDTVLENFKKNNGVTLITLIITVIIILILAGVTISVVTSDGGLFDSTRKAKEMYDISNEKEAIYIKTLYAKIDSEFNENNVKYLGKQLYDRNIANGNIWNIIYDLQNNKIYGTDWNYIEKGSYIEDYGYTKKAWLLNPNTLEILMLDDKSYTELSYNTSLGVTENLIFNLDSSVINDANKENITEQLGENVELINFNWNDDSGLTPTSFNLDGVNDYIKIQYDDVEEKETLKQNGFTFEFYGILNKGTYYDNNNEILENNKYNGIFCFWNGLENLQAQFRFGINNEANSIFWNAGFLKNEYSDFSTDAWNMSYPFEEELYNKELYFTITLDTVNEYEKDNKIYYQQTLYVNGEKLFEGGYNKLQWDNFKNKIDDLKFFCIGRSSMSHNGWWSYIKMNAYAIRLYNRALNQDEVLDNYNKSVAYHKLMG